jgi:subtilisin family serine protease
LPIIVLMLILALGAAMPVGAVPPDGRDPAGQNFVPGGVTGTVTVVAQLASVPLAVAAGPNAKQRGTQLSTSQQQNYVGQLAQQQNAVARQLPGVGGQEVARVSKALNALIVRIDAAQAPALAALPGVRSVRLLRDYELDLDETVPYIGATAVQLAGFDGTGVTVAVLDSGIDYTHYNLGGPGTAAAYEAAYGTSTADPRNKTRDGLFPTEKVYEGYDFVGEVWPSGELAPDEDPIDCGGPIPCAGGHGTHVADIIGGHSKDGAHKGVAPGVSLLAVKVCSAVSTSCSGVALLQGMDFAVDPNGDNSIADAVDVINMSLGSDYGQIEDDLSFAAANAVGLGVVVVASAGNAADRPYITGSPAATPELISVAQTQVPGALAYQLNITAPQAIAGTYNNTNTVAYAPVTNEVTGQVVYVGRACNGDALNVDPTGKIALVVRGTCAISQKVRNASDAGAIGVLVQNNAPGDPPSFSNGGECPEPADGTCAPTLILTQADGDTIRSVLAPSDGGTCTTGCGTVQANYGPSSAISLAGGVVASSARGPNYSFVHIKPDIGAPGASLSAEVGTGTGETAFSGTSGAAPMVAGSVALLLDAYPTRTPGEIKAILMNTAETDIYTNPATMPGVLAPITRIGGGEVRVDRALASETAAWDTERLTGSLSFGYQALSSNATFSRTVTIRNYASTARTYTIGHQFRYADDAASGAVTITTPATVTVPANGSATFTVQLAVNASLLPTWNLNGGEKGGNGSLLQSVEFDGYITIAEGDDDIHVAFHILPHKAASVTPATTNLKLRSGRGSLPLSNTGGAVAGRTEIFSLTGTSPQIASPPPPPGSNQARVDLKAVGVRQVMIGGTTPGVEFGITTWGERSHPAYPAEFDIYIDSTGNGTADYVIYNLELGGPATTGQTAVYVANLTTLTSIPVAYLDADLNSANAIFTVPLSAVGLTPGTQFEFAVYAFDNYFTGVLTDQIGDSTPMAYTLDTPRYIATGLPAGGVPAGGMTTLTVRAIPGGATASPSQIGFLLLYRDGKVGRESDLILVTP